MELLGKSLEDIFQTQQKKFSIKTVCMLGIQMLDRLEFVHSKNIIHRDIKPDNFVLGLDNKKHIVYILDFGLSKKFRSSRTHQHIKFNVNKKLTGTARYASINALRGSEQSRRDDLEAIGYVLLYFLRGNLPWQGLHVHKGEDRYKKILNKKKSTTAEELCQGFPKEFVEYVKYTRNLEFEADPDYKFLHGLLVSVLKKQNEVYDFWYDWVTEKPVITDQVAIERYTNDNTNTKLDVHPDEKNEKKDSDISKNNENEQEHSISASKFNTIDTINKSYEGKHYDSEVLKTNVAGLNISVDNNNNDSKDEDKKNSSRKSKSDKKKDKKDKENKSDTKEKRERCFIF